MKINYQLNKIAFEWDSNKAEINLRKHGVSFETASEVFEDPFLQVIDEQIIDNELREVVIGITSTWRLLYVVYVMREEVIRLISVRPVTNAERKSYENG